MWLRITVPCVLLVLLAGYSNQNRRHRRQGGNLEERDDCQTPTMMPGHCVNIKKCRELVDMLRNRTERQYLRESQCGVENGVPKVCCPSEAQGGAGGGETGLPGLDECGDNGFKPEVAGRPFYVGSWPWMVALGYRFSNSPLKWLCGGSLISERFVLTAAHCVTNLGNLTLSLARVGNFQEDHLRANATPFDIPVETTIYHEDFNKKTKTADIALVKLKNRVQFTLLTRPICLPTLETFKPDLTGTSPIVAGWGTADHGGPAVTHLHEDELVITDTESCAQSYVPIKGATIDDRVICAAPFSDHDSCRGHTSGGPLVLPKSTGNRENYFLVGLASYGRTCAGSDFPGIFTKVSPYIDWIKKNIK